MISCKKLYKTGRIKDLFVSTTADMAEVIHDRVSSHSFDQEYFTAISCCVDKYSEKPEKLLIFPVFQSVYSLVRMTNLLFYPVRFFFWSAAQQFQQNKEAPNMQKIYLSEELNSFSRETLVAVFLSVQDQLTRLNTNMERLTEQIAPANSHRYGRSCEKLDVIVGQLELEIILNEAEALTETLYVAESAEEDVTQVTRRKKKGKHETNLRELPAEVVSHTLLEEKLQETFGPVGWKQLPDKVYKGVRVQPVVYTVEEYTVSMCYRPMRLWSGYRRMGARQTARVTCGFIGRERDMGVHPLSCTNTRRPGKQTIRGNS